MLLTLLSLIAGAPPTRLTQCTIFLNALRVKAAAQHSSSELGSAFALHFPCTVNLVGGAPTMRNTMRDVATRCRWSRVYYQILGGAKRQSRA